MRYCLFVLAMLSAPTFAQTAQLTLSPATLSVAKGQTSTEIVLTYRPGANATDLQADVSMSLDRFAWAEAQVIPSSSPDYLNWCQVTEGRVRVLVISVGLQNLPAGEPIAVCRLRVRTHAHTSRGYYNLSFVGVDESWHGTGFYPVVTNNALVYVPY